MSIQDSPTLQLLPQEPNSLLSAQLQLKKRTPSLNENSHLDTVRKKVHIGEENDSTYLPETVKKRPSLCDGQSTAEKPQQNEQSNSPSEAPSNTPLCQKFAQLIPECYSQEYSLEQRKLLRIQNFLDEHLFYLKNHRGKKKGQFFKSLRKNLIQGSGIIMELHHLRQILFIDPGLYTCTREKVKDHSHDILIDLPSSDIPSRRAEFREKMHRFIRQHRGYERGRRVVIPLHKFVFQEEMEVANQILALRREQENAEVRWQQAKKERQCIANPKNFFDKSYQFRDKLDQLIEAKEAKLRQRQGQKERRFGSEQILRVIDEIFLAYSSKRVSNMFQKDLVERVSRKLLVLDVVVQQIVEMLLDSELFFVKRIENAKGVIVQIDNSKYRTCREAVKEKKLDANV